MGRTVAATLLLSLVVACAGPAPSSPAQSALAPTLVSPPKTAGPTSANPPGTPIAPIQTSAHPTETPGEVIGDPPLPPSFWTALSDSGSSPSPRQDHTWTVDDTGTHAYLFGGFDDDGPSNELWSFDLTAQFSPLVGPWSQVAPAGEPPDARFGHTATWVPDVGLVIWSGQGETSFFDDLWAYDPTANAWHQLPSAGAVPPARYGSCASIGPDGELWISHGFTQDDGRFADTRAYDFETGTWTDRTPEGVLPVKRCLHDCFWAEPNRLVLYGGQTTGVPAIGDIWTLEAISPLHPDVREWTEGPTADLPARQLYALAPTIEGAAYVFGGGDVNGGFLDDIWMLDAAAARFVPVVIDSASPPARSSATLINDAANNRLLLFGGQNAAGLLGDTWELRLRPL